jgi:RNA polymerase sigma-70 factor (ECF subfamily)
LFIVSSSMHAKSSISESPPPIEEALEQYRSYLRFLAEIKLDRRLQGRLDPSDIVQDTLLRAYRGWDTFRGSQQPQRLAWLRQILMRTILHALRDARRAKRDVGREQSLVQLADQSSYRIERWLAADLESPSQAAQKAEELMRIAAAIEQLAEPQRIAVLRYYWQGATLAEISRELGRSPSAVAGLVHRAVRRLQETLVDEP